METERFDIHQLTKEVFDSLKMQAAHRDIRFQFKEECDMSFFVDADKSRISQVLYNLITNAIKYSPKAREIIVNVNRLNDTVRVSVQDFGIGIASDQYDRIFSRFYRVENLAAHMSGLGIGLYISHEIINRHKGSIWVESEIGKGSTFYFELPTALN